ncbi:MAG: hypothetical protein V4696_02490, partial [Pseudomonadota bacterium]
MFFALLGSVAVVTPVGAMSRGPLETYVSARAADASGDPATAARQLASLVRTMPADDQLRRRAIGHAIEAGDMDLALELAGRVTPQQAGLDLRLLQVAEKLRRGDEARASALLRTQGGVIDASFIAPFVEAWMRADKRDPYALSILAAVPDNNPLVSQRDEHRTFILLKLKQPAEALVSAEAA